MSIAVGDYRAHACRAAVTLAARSFRGSDTRLSAVVYAVTRSFNGTDGTLRITADAAFPEIYPLTVAGAHGRNEPAELAVPAALISVRASMVGSQL